MPADPISSIIGLGTGLIGSIGKMFGNAKANRELRKLQGQIPVYQSSPYAQQRLSLAQTMLNAKMPGSATIEQGINTAQQNQLANIGRNATDSSQALLLGAGTQGVADQAYRQEGLDQNAYKQQALQNLTGAQEGMINEGDKVYQSDLNKFGDIAQIQGAMNKNRQDTWGSIANLGFGIADLGMNGGFGQKPKVTQTPTLF